MASEKCEIAYLSIMKKKQNMVIWNCIYYGLELPEAARGHEQMRAVAVASDPLLRAAYQAHGSQHSAEMSSILQKSLFSR